LNVLFWVEALKKLSFLSLILSVLILPAVAIAQTKPNPVRQGVATFYDAAGEGSCLFGRSSNNQLIAAMNAPEYSNAAACGAYVQVKGPKGTITVQIVNVCPECQAGHLDLSQGAFSQIADPKLGKVPISWKIVSPALKGPIAYHFKQGSSQWWTAVQIRNHRNPIAKLEYYSGGKWITVPRQNYNYFVQSSGMGPGPYQFRVTDRYGNGLSDRNIKLIENGTVNGTRQFPAGP
jgi:expansin